MPAIQLAYSTFGLTQLDLLDALGEVDRAGYPGVELAFHRDQFNPFELDAGALDRIARHLVSLHVRPACIATASHFFIPARPHEPSLLALERAARKRRIDLIRRGIAVARRLGVPLVTFGSGFLRDEHTAQAQGDPGALLIDSICECLDALRGDDDITLLIEPEPGMYIETLADGLALVRRVDSPRFKLHVDLCHAYCSEADLPAALALAAPETRYLHISDAGPGHNLKVVEDRDDLRLAPGQASTLVHFADTADYLFVDHDHPILFQDAPLTRARRARIDELLAGAGIERAPATVDYQSLYAGSSALDDEIFTWMISIPGVSFEVLERARPIVAHLRGVRGPALIQRMVANTRTGIVHFHDIPGHGTLDFAACFTALATHGFSGYGAIELYHHVASWQHALGASYRHLAPIAAATAHPREELRA